MSGFHRNIEEMECRVRYESENLDTCVSRDYSGDPISDGMVHARNGKHRVTLQIHIDLVAIASILSAFKFIGGLYELGIMQILVGAQYFQDGSAHSHVSAILRQCFYGVIDIDKK